MTPVYSLAFELHNGLTRAFRSYTYEIGDTSDARAFVMDFRASPIMSQPSMCSLGITATRQNRQKVDISLIYIRTEMDTLNDDLTDKSRQWLLEEIIKLRTGIREHRDSSGHDLWWHHPKLWGLLPEKTSPEVAVPPWPQFMRGCIKYRQSLEEELPGAPVDERESDTN